MSVAHVIRSHSRHRAFRSIRRQLLHEQRNLLRQAADWTPAATQSELHADVLDKGWNTARQAFTECYEDDTLDASALLIPLMGFLPIDHPQVSDTVTRIQEELTVDGFVYRSRDRMDGPVEKREGAFLPCSCWLAMVLAMSNRLEEAQAILDHVASVAGNAGILSEQVDPVSRELLGNLPLIFSHAEFDNLRLQRHFGLGEVFALRLGNILLLGGTGAQLHRDITVAISGADRNHLAIFQRQNGNRNVPAVFLEKAGHPHLLGDHACAHDQVSYRGLTRTIPERRVQPMCVIRAPSGLSAP